MRTSRLIVSCITVALAAGCHRLPASTPASPAEVRIASAADILARISNAYPEAPRTAAFTQVNTVPLSSGDITQRQRVLVEAPARMRIDNLPAGSGSGAIHLDGRAISFVSGRRVAAVSERNPLLLLGFSVFRQPAAASQAALAALGVRTSVIAEGSHGGVPVWIIGAAPGDTTSNQVWIDARRWVPLRIIQSQRAGARTIVSDTRYGGHAAAAPTIPRVIEVFRDGRRALRGTIGDVQVGVPVPAAAFDTVTFRPLT